MGILIDVSEVQLENANVPILVTPVGIEILVRLEHLENELPIITLVS